MSATLVAVVLRHQGPGLALLDRALFALAGQRYAPLHVILSDQAGPAQAPARKDLLALHAALGGFSFTHVRDDGLPADPALPALAATGARRVLFLDPRAWLHPQHLSALSTALDLAPFAPLALGRGRLALTARGPLDAPPFILHKRDLWPARAGFLPLDPLLPAACALLDLVRLHCGPADLARLSLPGLSALAGLSAWTHRLAATPEQSRTTHDALRVLDLLARRKPALAAGGPSFDLLQDTLPLRHRALELLQRTVERARVPLRSRLGPLVRALRRGDRSP